MLKSILEFRKGILFLRLQGSLDEYTYHNLDDVIEKIELNDINHIVINLENVCEIDLKGIQVLLDIYYFCKKKKGKSLLCGMNNNIKETITKSGLLKYIPELKSELNAFELMHI